MSLAKRDFDKEANSWDSDPLRVKIANDIFKCVSREIVLSPRMDIMDFGCGTGLVTIQLRPKVRSITGFDSSRGMLDVFKKKIIDKNMTRVEIHQINLEKGDRLKGQYHLIISSMTLHHIKNIKSLLEQFYKLLRPEGYLCIADLDFDDGKFHDSDDGIFHHGFDREALRDLFKKAGFGAIRDLRATEVVKTGKDGIARNFSIFLMIGRKN